MILLLWLYLMSIEFFSFCYPINAQSDSLVSQKKKKKKSLTIYEKHLSMRMKLFFLGNYSRHIPYGFSIIGRFSMNLIMVKNCKGWNDVLNFKLIYFLI